MNHDPVKKEFVATCRRVIDKLIGVPSLVLWQLQGAQRRPTALLAATRKPVTRLTWAWNYRCVRFGSGTDYDIARGRIIPVLYAVSIIRGYSRLGHSHPWPDARQVPKDFLGTRQNCH